MDQNNVSSFEERKNVASAFDCTGLMPAMPYDEDIERLEDEARMYAIHAPQKGDITEDNGRKEDGSGTNAAHRGGQE